MARKPEPGIKIPFFKADQYPEVEGTTCVEIRVPADPAFLPQLAGLVALATKAFYYEGDDFEHIRELSLMWKVAYNETDWGQCMNCEELTACITPLLDAQREQIIQDMTFKQYGTDDPTGVPLPEATRTANQAGASNPTCDYDILWSQCLQTIEHTIALVLAVLAKAEEATNPTELAAVLMQLPVVDELGGDAIAGYISFIQEGISDGYAADVTPTTYAEQAACELMCLARGDCSITLERIQQVFQARVESYFDTPFGAITTFAEFFGYFAGSPIDGNIVADALNLLVWTGGLLTNQFLGDVGTKTLQALLLLAVNDASSDWEILCEDCPAEWCIKIDATNGLDTLFFATGTLGAQATWTGTGWARNDAVASARITIGIDLVTVFEITSVRIVNSLAIANGDTNTKGIINYPSFTVVESAVADADVTIGLFPSLAVDAFAIDCISDAAPGGAAVPGEIIEVYISGLGTAPEIGDPCA